MSNHCPSADFCPRKEPPPRQVSLKQSSNATPAPTAKKPQVITKAAQPTKIFFDPYNSSATGHQRAQNRLSGSTSWRDSRTLKLAAQYRSAGTGGERLYDTVGAGSENFGKDGRKENGGWEKGASGLRPKGQRSIAEALGARVEKSTATQASRSADKDIKAEDSTSSIPNVTPSVETPKPQIFANLCIYINGSTAPLISDHRLKYILAEHGGRTSIALGRRTVTHVIVGRPSSSGGAGGGLSGSKIQKEVARVGGKGIKFVSPEWIVECVKAGRRLPEGRFQVMQLGGKGQSSVYGLFKRKDEDDDDEAIGKG